VRRTRGREAIPASLAITPVPVVAPTSDFGRRLEDLPVCELKSRPHTLEECARNRATLSEEFRQRFVSGDPRALARLLQIDRGFITEPWIQEALLQDRTLSDVVNPRGGRPVGRAADTEARGLLLVAYVEALKAKTGMSYNGIFERLSRVGLSPKRMQRLYQETVRDGRTRALLAELGPGTFPGT